MKLLEREIEPRDLVIIGIFIGIMLFFVGLASFIILGPGSPTNPAPYKISTSIKIMGMLLVCVSMIVGGVIIDEFDKDMRFLLVLFGVVILFINVLLVSFPAPY